MPSSFWGGSAPETIQMQTSLFGHSWIYKTSESLGAWHFGSFLGPGLQVGWAMEPTHHPPDLNGMDQNTIKTRHFPMSIAEHQNLKMLLLVAHPALHTGFGV